MLGPDLKIICDLSIFLFIKVLTWKFNNHSILYLLGIMDLSHLKKYKKTVSPLKINSCFSIGARSPRNYFIFVATLEHGPLFNVLQKLKMFHRILVQFEVLAESVFWFFFGVYWHFFWVWIQIIGGFHEAFVVWRDCSFVVFLRCVERRQEPLLFLNILGLDVVHGLGFLVKGIDFFEDNFIFFWKLRIDGE